MSDTQYILTLIKLIGMSAFNFDDQYEHVPFFFFLTNVNSFKLSV